VYIRRDFYGALLSPVRGFLAGNDNKTRRTLLWHVAMVFGFAFTFLAIGTVDDHGFNSIETFVYSIIVFHGRGFFSGKLALDDPAAIFGAIEAMTSLFIEIW
jgi:hypothetical protein